VIPVRGRAPKAAEVVADDLAGHILLTGMNEGDVLPNEREMTELFGVGRGTLREALRILETQGVITIRPGPGGGPVVRRPRPDDLAGNLTLLLQLMDVPFGQVLQAREVVEPLLSEMAGNPVLQVVAESLRRITADFDGAGEDAAPELLTRPVRWLNQGK
jgi:DNA-binding FadR family transcriptional regulator